MGVHGLLSQIGPGQRISIAKLAADHYATHNRPLRLAIDISIWLFQIQSGKGGSNPALRTFYYRLLRLLTLNIWPLFVFDGPNKPLFKRNKKVGGPGVRVANVPEFLAKQLLKHFGFPWHVAPGEAEAECALLQREGVVDAVLSEDVDTLMFGSGVTLRNWTSENTTKTPTHVNVYRAEQTKETSGMDREGMILVALMSGGDYLPEGIPGCGPKLACAAARAGYGRDLCALSRRDAAGIRAWRESLRHQIHTNEAKHFSRKTPSLTIPDDFPNLEVLGYYTHPCVSAPDKLARLKAELRWDQQIDFAALRDFTADAFDWRCIGGAKKFIKNLAPAMLVRELRLRGDADEHLDQEAQAQVEQDFVSAILGKRNHNIMDGELEYRICYIPAKLVPIDLSIEEEDDQFVPAGGVAEESDVESEYTGLPPGTQDDGDSTAAPTSPSKKRNFKPFDPDQPEKLWISKPFLQVGCPLLVEDYEAPSKDPENFLKARRKAQAAAKKDKAPRARKGKAANPEVRPENTLLAYATVTKAVDRSSAKDTSLPSSQANVPTKSQSVIGQKDPKEADGSKPFGFQLPATQIPPELLQDSITDSTPAVEVLDLAMDTPHPTSRPQAAPSMTLNTFKAFAQPKKGSGRPAKSVQMTPKRSKKRPSPEFSSPASQKTITSYYSPSPRKTQSRIAGGRPDDIVDLTLSSPISQPLALRPSTPTPINARFQFMREERTRSSVYSPEQLPDTVTKRRRREPLKRWQTEPALGLDDGTSDVARPFSRPRSSDQTSRPPLADMPANIEEPVFHGLSACITPMRPAASPAEHVEDWLQDTAACVPTAIKPHHRSPAHLAPPPRRSPRQHSQSNVVVKKRIQVRESLEGWWKEIDVAETVDLSGDGSGWKRSGGRARIVGDDAKEGLGARNGKGWRKSGVEVLDLTGA
ncbi:hypothetical protein BDY17DRAFT_303305 [Neohortaea acidophila]|uniref:XPG-I domain-containing protein n=1 Tax=Neohortaea acidophila TaxID=245834 RepID=A0A6A6PKF3_9PEZI|nr:uncharacterized protein BDY17DRAFT_303305 [Neohortaea acidophila]KAF2480144.1 hypothetical protein BDY17DRAFT_303305 [Neohortaea acidophila]